MGQTTLLKNDRGDVIGHMDVDEGTIRDDAGKVTMRALTDRETDLALSDFAAREWNKRTARQLGHDVMMKDSRGKDVVIKMDLAPSDVHVDAMNGIAGGYTLADGVADRVCPVVMTPKTSDKFWTWNQNSSFARAIPNLSAPGADVTEVQPAGGFTDFVTLPYALGSFIETEVQANADAPLDIAQKATRRVLEALRLEREIRVMTLLTNTANYASQNVFTLAATHQWNGGTASNPIQDMQNCLEAAAAPISFFVMSELVKNRWVTNANVQKFIAYKSGISPIPGVAGSNMALLDLPELVVAKMKYNNPSGAAGLQYVWPSAASASAVVGVVIPPSMPPRDQNSVATAYTARWNGGGGNGAPDGAMTGGFMIRRWFDPKRGPNGGTMVVVTHRDIEIFTSSIAGAIIVNPIQ